MVHLVPQQRLTLASTGHVFPFVRLYPYEKQLLTNRIEIALKELVEIGRGNPIGPHQLMEKAVFDL